MAKNVIFIRKEGNRYSFSGSGTKWTELPERLRTRADVEKYFGKDLNGNVLKVGPELQYYSGDRPAIYYKVFWGNGITPIIMENESRNFYIPELKERPQKNELISALEERAGKKNMGAIIDFMSERPEDLKDESL